MGKGGGQQGRSGEQRRQAATEWLAPQHVFPHSAPLSRSTAGGSSRLTASAASAACLASTASSTLSG